MHISTRCTVRPLLAGLAFLALLAPAVSEDKAVDPTPFLGTDWYGVYVQGKKVGYGAITVKKIDHKGTPAVLVSMNALFRVMAAGNKIEMKMKDRTVFRLAAPQEMLETHEVQEQAGQKVETAARRDGTELVVQRSMMGTAMPERRIPAPKSSLRDALAGQVLVASKPAVGTKVTHLTFDLDRLQEQTDSLSVKAIEKGFSNGIETKIYRVEMTDGRTGDRSTGKASGDGRLLEMSFGGGFVVMRIEPEKLAKDIQYSGDLFLGGLAKADKPLGDPRTVRMLKVRLRGVSDVRIVSDGRQTVTREDDGGIVVTIRRAPDASTLEAATKKDLADARRPTSEYPSDHPEIVAAAKKAVADAKTDAEKMRTLVRFVDSYVADVMSLTSMTALDVLRTKKGDCTEHTALFIAMARAVGLAARPVSGLMWGGDALGAFAGHAWAEVALGGRWVAVDPTWNQTDVDATHIRLGVDDQAEMMLKLYGKAKFEVLEIKRVR